MGAGDCAGLSAHPPQVPPNLMAHLHLIQLKDDQEKQKSREGRNKPLLVLPNCRRQEQLALLCLPRMDGIQLQTPPLCPKTLYRQHQAGPAAPGPEAPGSQHLLVQQHLPPTGLMEMVGLIDLKGLFQPKGFYDGEVRTIIRKKLRMVQWVGRRGAKDTGPHFVRNQPCLVTRIPEISNKCERIPLAVHCKSNIRKISFLTHSLVAQIQQHVTTAQTSH